MTVQDDDTLDLDLQADDDAAQDTPEADALLADEDAPILAAADEDAVIAAVIPELDAFTAADIKQALVPGVLDEEDPVPRAKNQQVSEELIQRPLAWEDWIDPGSI